MTLDQCSLEEHTDCFSYIPYEVLREMITVCEPAKTSTIQRSVSTSPASLLECLPLEVLHAIYTSLDFRSLSRLSRASIRNKIAVESFPTYRDLMRHASRTLSALGATKLISVHSSALLHAALHSATCVSCGEYGAFLFLPTCERICYECLHRNQSFWMIPDTVANRCFKITPRQLKTIPIMHETPEVHRFCRYRRSNHIRRLVSVKSVKKLAVARHGSETEVKGLIPAQPPQNATNRMVENHHLFKWLVKAPLEPLQSDPLTIPKEPNTPWDAWRGTASIHFPSLSSDNSLESGIWCRGCQRIPYWNLDSATLSRLVPPNVQPIDYYVGMKYRARSKADFLKHIQNCYGVGMLISESRGASDYR